MKNVLLAVDDSKGSQATVDTFLKLFRCVMPETVVLLYVQKIEGRSLMDEMLGAAELSTLKEALAGSEVQAAMDNKARTVLEHYRKRLEGQGVTGVAPLVRQGQPADEILEAAAETRADLIIIGSRGKRLHTLLMGSVSREIANRSEIPVLIAR